MKFVLFCFFILLFSDSNAQDKKTDTIAYEHYDVWPNTFNADKDSLCFEVEDCLVMDTFIIYNRWEELMWRKNNNKNHQCWTGININTGKKVNLGVYYLVLSYTDCDGEKKVYKSTTTVIRND